MFEYLLRPFRPRTLHDSFFGKLYFFKAARGYQSYWEAVRWFEPLGRPVGIGIDTPNHETAPSEEQRSFFLWVEKEYEAILRAAEDAIKQDEWGRQILRSSIEIDFVFEGFSIPLCQDSNKKWSISLSTTDESLVFTLEFDGLEVREISVDS